MNVLCEEMALTALENLAIMWDVKLRAVPDYTTYNLQLRDPADDKLVTEFNGQLKEVILAAMAWFDGVEFTFAEATQP